MLGAPEKVAYNFKTLVFYALQLSILDTKIEENFPFFTQFWKEIFLIFGRLTKRLV